MAYGDVQDLVFNPEVITGIMGQKWVYAAKVWQSGILASDSLPLEGLQSTMILQKMFQGRSGQALKAGGTISLANKNQITALSPIIFRYDGVETPDIEAEVEKKGVDMMNASMAESISGAGAEYVDDSVVKAVEGIGAMLTANQYDHSATGDITLAAIATAMQKLGDNSDAIQGGAIIMRSEKYATLLGLGLVAATSNTYGNAAQDEMVRQGRLPVNILGLTPIVSDKVAKDTNSPFDYFTYIVGRQALDFGYAGAPDIDTQKAYAKHKTIATTFKLKYKVGAVGVGWGGSAKEDVSDTELATSSNWSLKALSAKNVLIVRLQTT
jgi:hypothetical protein